MIRAQLSAVAKTGVGPLCRMRDDDRPDSAIGMVLVFHSRGKKNAGFDRDLGNSS
jgi:hypothetical protein